LSNDDKSYITGIKNNKNRQRIGTKQDEYSESLTVFKAILLHIPCINCTFWYIPGLGIAPILNKLWIKPQRTYWNDTSSDYPFYSLSPVVF
jgi:hypothetical protein